MSDPSASYVTWDSTAYPQSTAFNQWRDSVSEAPLRFSLDCSSKTDFRARLEIASLGEAVLAKHSSSHYVGTRTESDIAKSQVDGFLLMYQLSGEMELEQGKRTLKTSPGDVWVLDSLRPIRMTMGECSSLSLSVPRNRLSAILESVSGFDGMARCEKRTPLANCLELMSGLMTSGSVREMQCVYDACFSLLTVELRDDERKMLVIGSPVLREILRMVDDEIGNAELSPTWIAEKLHISPRYVHKLFLPLGMTFTAYVTRMRLDHVRADLLGSATQQPISAVAHRWGFNDPETLHRAFKKRFGCTPRQIFRR